MLTRTLSIRLYPTMDQMAVLDMLSIASKKLYNEALYKIREHYNDSLTSNQEYFNSIAYLGISYRAKGEYLSYYDLDPLMQQSKHYKLLGATSSKEILRLLDKSYKSWFVALKVKKEKGLRPKPPGFKPRDGQHLIVYNYTNFGFNGYRSSYKVEVKNQRYITLGTSKEFTKLYPQYKSILKFKVPAYLRGKYIKMIRILPIGDGYRMEFVYEIEPTVVPGAECMGIDLGLRNFATFVTTKGSYGIIDGSYAKAENRYYNKEVGRLKSVAMKQGCGRSTNKILTLGQDREAILNEFMNNAVAYIVNLCIKEGITKVAIGELKDIKQEINHGKIGNQSFVQIPYYKFKVKLGAKLELYGVELEQVSEAYTSQADALTLDAIKKQPYGKTRRIHRGLYESSIGKQINADVNGAINILRKVAGDAVVKQIVSRGSWTEPKRIRLAYEQPSLELNDCLSSHP